MAKWALEKWNKPLLVLIPPVIWFSGNISGLLGLRRWPRPFSRSPQWRPSCSLPGPREMAEGSEGLLGLPRSGWHRSRQQGWVGVGGTVDWLCRDQARGELKRLAGFHGNWKAVLFQEPDEDRGRCSTKVVESWKNQWGPWMWSMTTVQRAAEKWPPKNSV